MSQTDFLNLFIRQPGEQLYFFTLIAVSFASLFMALGQRVRRPDDRPSRRFSLALLGVVFAWMLLLGGAVYTSVTDRSPDTILPPVESFAATLTVLFLSWAFFTADHKRWGSLPGSLLFISIIVASVGYVLTTVKWVDLAGSADYNLSEWGVTWAFAVLVLSSAGAVLMIANVRWIADAPLKLVFYLLLIAGYGTTLLQIATGSIIGDYAGPSRLAFAAAITLVPVLVYRMIVARLEDDFEKAAGRLTALKAQPPALRPPVDATPTSPLERESAQLFRALGLILENATAATIPEQIINAVIEVLKVDVAGLLRLQDANYADFSLVFDQVMKRSITGIALNLDHQPTLATAIERRLQRSLDPETNADELRDLYTRLDIEQTGPVYFQPLTKEQKLVAVLMIAFPYSQRKLYGAEAEMLRGIAVIAGGLLALSNQANESALFAEERAIQSVLQRSAAGQLGMTEGGLLKPSADTALQVARDQITQLSKQVMQLKLELDDARSQVAQDLGSSDETLSASQQIRVLNQEQHRLREERDMLAKRLQEAEAALSGATARDRVTIVNNIIESLKREKDDLQLQKERMQVHLGDLRASDKSLVPVAIQAMIAEMAEEKNRLEQERDQFSAQLVDIHSQLESLGLEPGSAGVSQVIGHLIDQNNNLQAQANALQLEVDRLTTERVRLEHAIEREEARVLRIQMLESEVRNLAGDREALTKQRDRLKAERDELQNKIEIIKQHRARLLAQVSGYEIELKEAHDEQEQLRLQYEQLANERSDLLHARDRLLAEKQALETEREQLLARTEGDRERLQEVGETGVGSLTEMIETLTRQRSQIEHELNQTRTQLATVQNQLEALQVRMKGETVPETQYSPQNPELLMSLVQELRNPLTSISGYVELLLKESAGIIGEMQRSFLQRVMGNIARLEAMLNDLIRVTALDTGRFRLHKSRVNVLQLIDTAIENASTLFREKRLAVNLSVQPDLPEIEGDQDAISQVIGQLLTNAYLVSPPNTEIFISAKRHEVDLSDNGSGTLVDCLFVSVEDRGGGIAPEDEARVFVRKYKAENPLIQGLGDTGVGLSIAKALVESHGGRLWLETQENVGTTFHFVLPVASESQPEAS